MDSQLYALSCPLPASEAAARLRTLGPTIDLPAQYRGSTAFEVAVGEGPLAPLLDVSVEERPVGSYVTVRVVRSTFLGDLMHLGRCAFGLWATIGAGYAAVEQAGPALARTLCLIGGGFGLFVILTVLLERALQPSAPEPHRARLRLDLGRLVARR